MSRKLRLSIALSDNERTRPLLDGRVSAAGMRLVATAVHPSEMFWRQLRYGDFDISEMSLSSLLIAKSRGDDTWAALPIFTMRRFFHTGILVRADAGIEHPADLRGKRVGVPEYQQTAAIWARGILQHDFGVHPRDINCHMERGADRSHGHSTGFKPPADVKVEFIPEQSSIGQALASGRIDATLLYLNEVNLVDRSRTDLNSVPQIRKLFPDAATETKRYFSSSGFIPVNHTLVVRRSLLEREPWIALNLYSAFLAAKSLAETCAHETLNPYIESGLIPGSVQIAMRERDPMAYGLRINRPVLETVARYVYEQGLTPRLIDITEIFARNVQDL